MKLSIYGDVHLTKKMGNLQGEWDASALKVFKDMYDDFSSKNIEFAVCLGDFFDAPRLEAKSVNLITEILSIIDNSPFPTYFLLGNHEIFDEESNILEFLHQYNNIIPVTEKLLVDDQFLFLPYSVSLHDIDSEEFKDKYVFTHHDIYGSELAGGKVKASFGCKPEIFSLAKRVFNGHVHLMSAFQNIINVGSLLKSQQGELRCGETPRVIYLDTKGNPELSIERIERNFIAYISVAPSSIGKIIDMYDKTVKFIIRVEYDEDEELDLLKPYEDDERILRITMRKNIKDLKLDNTEYKHSKLDVKELLTSYIKNDNTIDDRDKEDMLKLGISLLEVRS